MRRTLVERVRALYLAERVRTAARRRRLWPLFASSELFVPLGGAEEDPIWVGRDHPALGARGVSWRQIKRWAGEGDDRKLRPYHPGGRYGPLLIKLQDLDDLIQDSAGPEPTADAPGRVLDATDALATRYESDPRPGSRTHRILVQIKERVDRALSQ